MPQWSQLVLRFWGKKNPTCCSKSVAELAHDLWHLLRYFIPASSHPAEEMTTLTVTSNFAAPSAGRDAVLTLAVASENCLATLPPNAREFIWALLISLGIKFRALAMNYLHRFQQHRISRITGK